MLKHFKPLAAALCAAAILTAAPAHAGDDWTPAQQGKGLALATLLIRFALAAPAYYAPAIGIAAMAMAYGGSRASEAFEADA